jgi:uncharacterized protein (TIGR00730 family)
MMMEATIRSICVFCGSADGLDAVYYEGARNMGAALAQRKIRLVYGAGKTGLMGAVADGALEAGGEVIGVIPENLNTPRLAHQGLTKLEVTNHIHARKARMSELADAFIALPGGYGTFDELFEQLTWAQIGIHAKPMGLLNTLNYYDPLMTLVQRAITEGFIYAEHKIYLVSSDSPDRLLDMLNTFEPPKGVNRWLNRED